MSNPIAQSLGFSNHQFTVGPTVQQMVPLSFSPIFPGSPDESMDIEPIQATKLDLPPRPRIQYNLPPLTDVEENMLLSSIFEGIIHEALLIDQPSDETYIFPTKEELLGIANMREPHPQLTVSERLAIYLYTGFGYRLMNGLSDLDMSNLVMYLNIRSNASGSDEALYNNIQDYDQLPDHDKLYLQSLTPDIEKLVRAMISGMAKLPPNSLPIDKIYRGDVILKSQLNQYQKGNYILIEKFLSCSSDDLVGEKFIEKNVQDYSSVSQTNEYYPTRFIIINPKRAISISQLASSKEEDEYIYPPGTLFKVKEIYSIGSIFEIYLEEKI